jgi:hypothetical protein
MVPYGVVLGVALAGYMGAPGWAVLPGAACLTLDGWRLWRLGRQARGPWTSKATTYFVSGIVADLLLAALAFGAGRMARILLA